MIVRCCMCGHEQKRTSDILNVCEYCNGITDAKNLYYKETKRIPYYKLDRFCFPYDKINGFALYRKDKSELEKYIKLATILNEQYKEL